MTFQYLRNSTQVESLSISAIIKAYGFKPTRFSVILRCSPWLVSLFCVCTIYRRKRHKNPTSICPKSWPSQTVDSEYKWSLASRSAIIGFHLLLRMFLDSCFLFRVWDVAHSSRLPNSSSKVSSDILSTDLHFLTWSTALATPKTVEKQQPQPDFDDRLCDVRLCWYRLFFLLEKNGLDWKISFIFDVFSVVFNEEWTSLIVSPMLRPLLTWKSILIRINLCLPNLKTRRNGVFLLLVQQKGGSSWFCYK